MVQLNVNSASDETLRAMSESGCVYIRYGIESMSQPILDSMMKKSKKARVEEPLALTRKYKIGIQGNLLFGDSAETIDTANESMHWWANNREYQINLTPLIVFPGSPDYQAALRDGLIKQSDRESYVKHIPTDLNISLMNDENMSMVRFMVYVYFESLLRPVELGEFVPVGSTDQGIFYNCTWLCPTCSSQNEYRNFYIPQDSKNSIRMTCRSCRERFDIENVPYQQKMAEMPVPGAAYRLLERAELEHKLGRYAEAHESVNNAIRLCDYFVEARLFLARFYEMHGPAEHMIRSYGSAVSFDPYRADLHFFYAVALSTVGLNGASRLFLDQAILLTPYYTEALDFRDRLLKTNSDNASLAKYFRSWSDAAPPLRIGNGKCGADEVDSPVGGTIPIREESVTAS